MVNPEKRSILSLALAFLALNLLFCLFVSRFKELSHIWSIDDTYSHGYLVPFISAYLAWEIFRQQGLSLKGSLGGGLMWMAIGIAFHLGGLIFSWSLPDFVGLGTILYGIAVLIGGRNWASHFGFPLLFLFFMFPLPPGVTDSVAVWLQGIVSTMSTFFLQMMFNATQKGNVLEVAGNRLEVGEACSGLRQLIAFAALALLVAQRSERSGWFKACIVLSALPVAIAANLLRVLLMSIITVNFGATWISEEKEFLFGVSYHTSWGLLTMVAGLGLFLGVRWWLTRAFPLPESAILNSETPELSENPETKETTTAAVPHSEESLVDQLRRALGHLGRRELSRPMGIVAGVLTVGILLHMLLFWHLEAAAATTSAGLAKPLSSVPVSLGAWTGQEVTPDDRNTLPYFLQADDRLNRKYTVNPSAPGAADIPEGLTCSVFMVHFKDASDRRHHPLICYKVAGCDEDPSQRQELDFEGQDGKIARFSFTRDGGRSYVYYWHYTLEPTGVERLGPLQDLHQRVAVRRPSVTIQVHTNGYAPEHLEKVAAFVRLVDAHLQECLPQGARRGCEALPVKFVR